MFVFAYKLINNETNFHLLTSFVERPAYRWQQTSFVCLRSLEPVRSSLVGSSYFSLCQKMLANLPTTAKTPTATTTTTTTTTVGLSSWSLIGSDRVRQVVAMKNIQWHADGGKQQYPIATSPGATLRNTSQISATLDRPTDRPIDQSIDQWWNAKLALKMAPPLAQNKCCRAVWAEHWHRNPPNLAELPIQLRARPPSYGRDPSHWHNCEHISS